MLRDLVLAGVMWELCEAQFPQSEDLKVESSDNLKSVPPIAPTAAPDVANINDIDTLIKEIENFNHPLKQFSKNTVLPELGVERLFVITDMPSNDDIENGKILTGPAGELFDKMIGAIGLTRADISIFPLVFWRTPGGRGPTREELDLTLPFVTRAIELLKPSAILTLGTLAQAEINTPKIPIVSIFHPNYLLLKPDAKRTAWDQLQKLLKIMG